MRIRRRLSQHDQITTLAAERDAALRARDAWRDKALHPDSQSTSEPPCGSDLAPYLDDSHVSPDATEAWDTPTESDLRGWWPVVKAVSLCLTVAALFVGGLFWLSSSDDTEIVNSTSRRLSRIEDIQENTIDMQQNTIKVQDDSILRLKEAMARLEEAMRIARKRIYDERYRNQQQTPTGPLPSKATTVVCGGASLDCDYGQGQYQNKQSYNNNLVQDDGPQVDVRARAGDRSIGDPGSGYAE